MSKQVKAVTDSSQTVNLMANTLLANYVDAINCAIATESCSKWPRPHKIKQAMEGGIEALYAAKMLIDNKGKAQEGGFMQMLMNMAQSQADEQETGTVSDGNAVILNELKKIGKRLEVVEGKVK